MTLDHVVVCVDELGRATADWTTRGFTVLQGGTHANGASRNALIVLDDGAYLELLEFTDRASPRGLTPLGRRMWERYQRRGEGLVEVSLWSRALDEDLAAARAAGLMIEGPIAGARVRPDGQRCEFLAAVPAATDLPFLCADVTPRALRVPPAAAHANGAIGIDRVAIAVDDLAASAARYQALLGTTPTATGETVSFSLGETRLVLTDSRRVAVHGEGPYEVGLKFSPTTGSGLG